jgi:tetratricopeptide (TPR) repeat protein
MQPLTPAERNWRRRLIFQDTLALLSLTVILILIAVLTFYFFRSFQQHRGVLEKRWFARGEQALKAGDPTAAVLDFRSALSLSTANPRYELALAEALAAANRNTEAYSYFSTLRDAKPGDGYLNLQLARLAVKRGDSQQAIDDYRNALTGLWYGQGIEQRFQIRLELARYLMSLGKNIDAQGDLLAAEGNSLDDPAKLLSVADLLRQAGGLSDAWTIYRRVELHRDATPAEVLRATLAGAQVSVALGQYKRAAVALGNYDARVRLHPTAASAQEKQAAEQQLDQIQQLLRLIPFSTLPPVHAAERIRMNANIAHRRYAKCSSQMQVANASVDDLTAFTQLGNQWKQFGSISVPRLAKTPSLQQAFSAWTSQTEILTAKLCGPPSGDDALLLQLARTPDKSE